ncbi:MAG: hypothetical protein AB1384_08475 [Actinomycetota bacterium]
METTSRMTGSAGLTRLLYPAAYLLSFTALSLLSGRSIDTAAGFVAVFTLLGMALACLLVCGLAALSYATNPRLRATCDYRSVLDLYARSFVMLLPFAVLALAGEVLLDWSIALVFTQAGIMTAGTLAGLEIVKLSDNRTSRFIVPILGAFSFSLAWLLFCAAAQAVVG